MSGYKLAGGWCVLPSSEYSEKYFLVCYCATGNTYLSATGKFNTFGHALPLMYFDSPEEAELGLAKALLMQEALE